MGGPLDLKLTKTRDSKLVKTRYIKVKTTQAGGENTTVAHFSAKEIVAMLQYGSQYTFYRVYNAKEVDPRVERTRDPWQRIKDEELEIDSIGLKV
jgi:hypothetical protein